MPLTRATSRANSTIVATKIPKPTTSRKRGIVSPANPKHKQCAKRTALGDITNQVLKESTDNILNAKKPVKKAAFTVFEEPNIEPESKKAKKCSPDTSDLKKNLVVQNPNAVLAQQKRTAKLAKPVEVSKPEQKWRDIDADTTDPMFAPEYAADIFVNLQKRELDFLVGDYLTNQAEITVQMRAILIDWLVEVQETFELFHETLYLAVRMVDRYLDKRNVRKLHLQLLGVTAIFLASKMEERYPPPLEDFIFVCDKAYSEDEILKMERVLCSELEYEVYMPLSYSFLRRYGKCVNADMRLLTIGRYVLELSLQEYQYVTYRPSKLAAAALYFSMKKTNKQEWDATLEHYTQYKAEELDELVKMMNSSTIRAQTDDKCTTIYKKYSHQVFFKVALLPALEFADQ